jgi:hypothetical protein
MARKKKIITLGPVDDRGESISASGGSESPQPTKNPHAQALGKLGGLKGGKARAKKLTPEKRKEIAKKAAAARWGKKS